jgi:glycerophosphoryl diester phosphodiesterase
MLKVGHRGAPFCAPENTISSFKKAVELGADGIELDVHLCKSGEVVVIHDERVERTTNGTGEVSDLTLAQLRSMEVAGGERIPALAEALDALGGGIRYFIEIKCAEAALPAVEIVRRYIGRGWNPERLTLISFDHEALRLIAGYFPHISLGASFERLQDGFIEQAKAVGARAVIPCYQALNPCDVEAAHRQGLAVIPWTVNNTEDIARIAAMQVDGIISDYPERLRLE